VRRAWVGLVLPLEEGLCQPQFTPVCGVRSLRNSAAHVFIINVNAAIEALEKHDPEAAAWWVENTPHLLRPDGLLCFHSHVCELVE
jgi:hypothetical protein